MITALEACAASTSCNGVTKEGVRRYRLNTGNSPRKVNNMECYIKEGSFDVQNGKSLKIRMFTLTPF